MFSTCFSQRLTNASVRANLEQSKNGKQGGQRTDDDGASIGLLAEGGKVVSADGGASWTSSSGLSLQVGAVCTGLDNNLALAVASTKTEANITNRVALVGVSH